MMGINAVKGVEIGAGFASVMQRGTTHGDSPTPRGFRTNNAGGVLGGISTGQDLEVSIAIKPTSSILSPRETINLQGQATQVVTKGRHDPCVGIRAAPIAEAMLALVVMEHALRQRAQNSDVQPPIAPIAASSEVQSVPSQRIDLTDATDVAYWCRIFNVGIEQLREAVQHAGHEVEAVRRYLDGKPLSLIHISEPTRRTPISYAVFCLKKKKKT